MNIWIHRCKNQFIPLLKLSVLRRVVFVLSDSDLKPVFFNVKRQNLKMLKGKLEWAFKITNKLINVCCTCTYKNKRLIVQMSLVLLV